MADVGSLNSPVLLARRSETALNKMFHARQEDVLWAADTEPPTRLSHPANDFQFLQKQ